MCGSATTALQPGLQGLAGAGRGRQTLAGLRLVGAQPCCSQIWAVLQMAVQAGLQALQGYRAAVPLHRAWTEVGRVATAAGTNKCTAPRCCRRRRRRPSSAGAEALRARTQSNGARDTRCQAIQHGPPGRPDARRRTLAARSAGAGHCGRRPASRSDVWMRQSSAPPGRQIKAPNAARRVCFARSRWEALPSDSGERYTSNMFLRELQNGGQRLVLRGCCALTWTGSEGSERRVLRLLGPERSEGSEMRALARGIGRVGRIRKAGWPVGSEGSEGSDRNPANRCPSSGGTRPTRGRARIGRKEPDSEGSDRKSQPLLEICGLHRCEVRTGRGSRGQEEGAGW